MSEVTFYNSWIKPNLPTTKREWIKFWVYIVVVISVCAIGMNQFIALNFKLQLLQTPCELCESFGNHCSRVFQLNLSDLNMSVMP